MVCALLLELQQVLNGNDAGLKALPYLELALLDLEVEVHGLHVLFVAERIIESYQKSLELLQHLQLAESAHHVLTLVCHLNLRELSGKRIYVLLRVCTLIVDAKEDLLNFRT